MMLATVECPQAGTTGFLTPGQSCGDDVGHSIHRRQVSLLSLARALGTMYAMTVHEKA